MKIDISNGLSAIYLWLIFGITLSLFNCKMVKLINQNILLQYSTLFVSIFFLFIVLESENSKKHISVLLLNSLIVFISFIILIKINKIFSILILLLILLNQILKVHINYLVNNNIYKKNNNIINYYKKIRNIINILIVVLIIIGFFSIIIENGYSFNLYKFLSNNKC
jgi:hypothetical protein